MIPMFVFPILGVVDLTFGYLLVAIDKLDEALEWFALVIGNILDATVNKDEATD